MISTDCDRKRYHEDVYFSLVDGEIWGLTAPGSTVLALSET